MFLNYILVNIFSNISMLNLLSESITIGIITFIIGTIIFNLSINKSNKDEIKPYGINFAFFITGVILHILLEVMGFNKWYCNKKYL
jgi:hypothetical protein